MLNTVLSSLQHPVYWHWFIATVLLITLEIVLPTTFMIWVGIGAFLTGVVLWIAPELTWQVQLIVFAVFSVASIIAGRAWVSRRQIKTDRPLLNRRGEQYIGRVLTLSDPIVNGVGHVSLDDTRWRIEGSDLPARSRIVVTGVDGTSLRVQAHEDDAT